MYGLTAKKPLQSAHNGKRVRVKTRLEIPFELSEPECWSPNRPQMYRYELEIAAGGQTERVENAFGCRSIQADGSRIL